MSSPTDQSIIIRKLRHDEGDLYCEFLISLDAETRRNRFCGGVSDAYLCQHAKRILSSGAVLYGAFQNGRLRGVAELHAAAPGEPAEAAFVVTPDLRDHGIGTALLDAVVLAARNRNHPVIRVTCLRTNEAMRRLAQKADARLVLTYDEAASVPLVFLTAWHMLVGRARIQPGQSILILGASSGVGSAAIQIAKLFNCRVIATAGSEWKLDRARELGADFTIDHYKQKISDEVKKITSKQGVDVVFEHVGQATWSESIRSLRAGGTLVTCGATTGFEGSIDLRVLFARQLSLLGSFMGNMGEFHEVMKHVFAGRLKPVVDKSFPLRDAAAAHEYLAKSSMFGKVILNP